MTKGVFSWSERIGWPFFLSRMISRKEMRWQMTKRDEEKSTRMRGGEEGEKRRRRGEGIVQAWGAEGEAVAPICWTHLPNSVNLVKARPRPDMGMLSKAGQEPAGLSWPVIGQPPAGQPGGRPMAAAGRKVRPAACYKTRQADRSVLHGAARRPCPVIRTRGYRAGRRLIGNDTVKLTVPYNEQADKRLGTGQCRIV